MCASGFFPFKPVFLNLFSLAEHLVYQTTAKIRKNAVNSVQIKTEI